MIHVLKQIINLNPKIFELTQFSTMYFITFFLGEQRFSVGWRIFIFVGYVDVISLVVLPLLLGFQRPSQFPVLHHIVLPFQHLLRSASSQGSFVSRSYASSGLPGQSGSTFDSVGRGVIAVVSSNIIIVSIDSSSIIFCYKVTNIKKIKILKMFLKTIFFLFLSSTLVFVHTAFEISLLFPVR